MMDPRIPERIKPLLEDYFILTEKQLPGLIHAFYLEGSLALGAFNEQWSDIDFIAVLSRSCTRQEVEQLQTIHQRLESSYPRWSWQGEYLRWEDWTQSEHGRTISLIYHDGHFQSRTQLDLHTTVMSWMLQRHGLALKGPDPQQLNLKVDWNVLLTQMQHNLNTYWASFTKLPWRMAWLFTDYGIQWGVLGVLRQWYTIQEHDITSKTKAGEYALAHFPQKWHRLIREALNIREQRENTRSIWRIGRAIEAIRLLRHVIRMCNEEIDLSVSKNLRRNAQ